MAECSESAASAGCSSPAKAIEEVKSPPSDRASSPETNCAICLGKPQNKSFTDSCLHQFCFTCLLEWSKVKAECPLCKQGFSSIIHTVRSIEDYEQYYVQTAETRIPVEDTIWPSENPFRYRTTVTSYLEYFVRIEGAIAAGHHIIPPAPPRPAYNWRRRRQHGTSEYRRNIYNLNLWVQRMRDVTGRYRECSPEFYRLNPAQIHRLVPWLNRELNVLLPENLTQMVLQKILDLLKQHHIRSVQFREALSPYIRCHTDHFIHEFHSFATSPYDMIGYDRNCNYVNYFNIAHELDSSSSSSDSDVQIVSETVRDHHLNTISSPVPGPSGLGPTIEVVTESDPEDCMIVGAVKPRHERTPEIITIESDDEAINRNKNEVNEIAVHSSDNEVVSLNAGPSCSHKPRTKAQKKQFTVNVKQRDQSSDSGGSSILVDYHSARRKRLPERSVNGHPRIVWYSNSSSNISSDDDSDEEWSGRKEKRGGRVKKKKETNSKRELKKKRSSKDSKRKGKSTKHWKKKLCHKNDEYFSSSDESSPIQLYKRRKSVALCSSPEPDNISLQDHDYPLTNPYSASDNPQFFKGRPRLRSVVIKNDSTQRNTGYQEDRSRHKSPMSDSSRTSKNENPGSSTEHSFSKWRHQRASSISSVDSSSRNLYDRLVDLQGDQWMQRPSTSSNVTWLGRHYIDTYNSLNPVRYNLCNSYTSKGNQQDGQSSTSSSSRQHKRKHSGKDKNEKRKKSS